MPFVLKDTNLVPPGGYSYHQPETNYTLQNEGLGFLDAAKAIQAHRKANPKFEMETDFVEITWDLEDYTVQRLNNHPQWCMEVSDNMYQQRRMHPAIPRMCGGCG